MITAALTLVSAPVAAQTQVFDSSAGPIEVTRAAGPFESPWGLAFLPDGRFLVTEREGRLLVADAERIVEVANAPDVAAHGQGGLLDVTLDPEFASSGRLYLSFSERDDDGVRTAVASATLSLESAPRLDDVKVIFRQQPALESRRHFGSRIVVAADGTLFIGLGDRGDRDRAQLLTDHIGVVARITPDGGVPNDNPYRDKSGVRPQIQPEIWSYGHRNIQGAALRPEDGALWTVEHGASGGDEINRPEAGKNFGWPQISYGRHYSGRTIGIGAEAPGMEQPVHYWDPSIAPSGLAFYEGDLFPEWRGDLLVGALKYELISRLELEGNEVVREERLFEGAFGRIRDLHTGPDGAIWFITDENDGAVYRAAPQGR
ncbi:MAG: PQQ-dependent sugar dehydrogenase [Rhodobacteraceae bacterium]|nr:PQQ-dependent sugar dehydrogenase [Paracoccaceae bacterium]